MEVVEDELEGQRKRMATLERNDKLEMPLRTLCDPNGMVDGTEWRVL